MRLFILMLYCENYTHRHFKIIQDTKKKIFRIFSFESKKAHPPTGNN